MRRIREWGAVEWGAVGVAVALLLCLMPLPYGFYTVVRLGVAVVAGCWAYTFFQQGKTAAGVVSCAILLLFQPFFKIVLDRLTWNVIDVVLSVVIFCIVAFTKRS